MIAPARAASTGAVQAERCRLDYLSCQGNAGLELRVSSPAEHLAARAESLTGGVSE